MPLSNKTFVEVFTFNRASTGTYFDFDGKIKTAAIDTPRFEYDPTTGEALGIKSEKQSTNLLLFSQDASNGNWLKQSVSATYIGDDSPVGSFYSIKTTTAGVSARFSQTILAQTEGWYTASCIVKRENTDSVRFFFDPLSDAQFKGGTFNLITGSVIMDSPIIGSMRKLKDDWWELTITGEKTSPSGQVKATIIPLVANVNNIAANEVGFGFYFAHQQFEKSKIRTSYIPTTTTQVTRDFDSIEVSTISNFFNFKEGGLFVEFNFRTDLESGNTAPRILEFQNAGATDRYALQMSGDSRIEFFPLNDSGSISSPISLKSAVVVEGKAKAVIAYDNLQIRLAVNGVLYSTPVVGSIPLEMTRLKIGGLGASNREINGHIKNIKYFPSKLSDEEMKTLSI